MKVVSTASNRTSRRVQASESRISSQLTCAKERTTLRNEDGLARQVPLLTVFGIVELGIVLGRFSLSSFVSTISWPKTHRLACMRLKLPLHNNAGTDASRHTTHGESTIAQRSLNWLTQSIGSRYACLCSASLRALTMVRSPSVSDPALKEFPIQL